MRKPEYGTLVWPSTRDASQQLLDDQRARLPTFDDRLDDVRCKIADAQDAADVGIVELKTARNLPSVRISAAAKVLHPGLGPRDREDEIVADSTWGRFRVPRNDDLPTGARLRGRHPHSMDPGRAAVFIILFVAG